MSSEYISKNRAKQIRKVASLQSYNHGFYCFNNYEMTTNHEDYWNALRSYVPTNIEVIVAQAWEAIRLEKNFEIPS